MMERILVALVDDEQDIRELLELHLKRAGYETASFDNGGDFLSWLEDGGVPSLCILDIMLPDVQGTDICRRMRLSEFHSSIPVIMLTALDHETDRVTGLELGADDYVTKPFSPRELVARVRAVLRRVSVPEAAHRDQIVTLGSVEINGETYSVKVSGKAVELTSTEFRILHILMKNPGKVFTRSRLLDLLWGGEKFVFERTIDVHISHIREKLGEASSILQNVRGIGYKMNRPEK